MELIEINAKEYEKYVSRDYLIFCQAPFLELNRYKVETVRYFLAEDTKKRIAVAMGEQERTWRLPYSAPFGMPVLLQKNMSIEYFIEFVKLLKEEAAREQITKINLFLPPMFYQEEEISKWIHALCKEKFTIIWQELNFEFNLKVINEANYKEKIQRNARKNLNIAMQADLKLIYCEEDESKQRAYEIINQNRREKGYPLRMSYDQIKETIQIVQADFFIVKKEKEDIAAAIVFAVNKRIMQVVYWGDIQGYKEYKPINYLAFELMKYYAKKKMEYLDIGPSSEKGIANIGLCNFKESIGCNASSKFMLEMQL